MATPDLLDLPGSVQAVSLTLALSSLLLCALYGGLRALSLPDGGERVGYAAGEVHLARAARGAGESLEHGKLRWHDATGGQLARRSLRGASSWAK